MTMRLRYIGRLVENQSLGTGKVMRVVIIESGTSRNGNYYSPQVLKEAIGLFEGRPVGIYRFGKKFDHVPREVREEHGGGLAGNTVGWLSDVRLESVPRRHGGGTVEALTGDLNVTDPWFQTTVREAWDKKKYDLMELSIEAAGPSEVAYREGRRVNNVLGITVVHELTAVSDASAGGRILALKEGYDGPPGPEGQDEAEPPPASSSATSSDAVPVGAASEAVGATAKGGWFAEALSELREAWKPGQPIKPAQASAVGKSGCSECGGAGCAKCQKKRQYALGRANASNVQESHRQATEVSARRSNDLGARKLKEGNMGRKALVRALRSLGHEGPLEESTNEEMIETLRQHAADGSMEPELATQLKEALKQVEGGDSQMLESMLFEEDDDGEPDEVVVPAKPAAKPAATTAPAVPAASTANVSEEARQVLESIRSERAALQADREAAQAAAQQARLTESRMTLKQMLASANLPEVATSELANRFAGRVFEAKELREAIESQRRVITKVTDEFRPQNSRVTVGPERVDRMSADLDRVCGYDYRKDTTLSESQKDVYRSLGRGEPSVRRWFQDYFDDPECRLNYAGPNALFREAVAADLPSLLGDSMTRSLMQQYNSSPPPWRSLAEVVPVTSFRTQRRILIGGLGKLPIVTESDTAATYLTLGFPRDEERTYAVDTRGGLIVVTRKAIINDDLQGIQRFPTEAARSATNTLTEQVLKALLGNLGGGGINTDTSYDGGVIYSEQHRNYSTTALSYTELNDAYERILEQRMFGNVLLLGENMDDSQTYIELASAAEHDTLKAGDELQVDSEILLVGTSASSVRWNVTRAHANTVAAAHTGVGTKRVEQIGAPIDPSKVFVVHPNQKRAEVFHILASSNVPGSLNLADVSASALYSDYKDGRIQPLRFHSSYLAHDRNNFYLAMEKAIEVGFLGGREDPELLLQDNPLVGGVFTGDQITWKVRHEYGVLLKDHRYVHGNIVSGT